MKQLSITTPLDKKISDMYKNGYSGIKIAKRFGLSKTTIYKILRNNNVKIRSNKINSRKYTYNDEYFNKINTSEKAYWLGFIYADGYVSGIKVNNPKLGIALSIRDKEHLEKFKNNINSEHPIHIYEPTESSWSDNKYCRIQIFGDKIYNDLVSLGVIENKTDNITKPKINNKFKKDFIRGYYDGDGSISAVKTKNNTDRLDYYIKICGTIDILDYIKEFIETNGVASINNYYKRKKDNNTYHINIGGNIQVKNFLDLLYKDSKLYLDRKYNKYISLCKQSK